jgi:hypothetical protein
MAVSIPFDSRFEEPLRAASPVEAPPRKQPTVDMIGVYTLAEPRQLEDPKSHAVFDVKPGEYPVMGVLSADGKKVAAAGVIFAGTRETQGVTERVSIAEKLRPIDVPALVQRQQLRLEQSADRSLKFPLAMFLGEAPATDQSQTQSQSRTQSHDHSQGRALSR